MKQPARGPHSGSLLPSRSSTRTHSPDKPMCKHTELVSEHTEVMSEHKELMSEHTELMSEHTQMMSEHTELVFEHTELVSEHTELVFKHTELASSTQSFSTPGAPSTPGTGSPQAGEHAAPLKIRL